MIPRLRTLVACLAVALAGCAHASLAHGLEWQPPVDGCVQLLGYGSAYGAGTHRGVDLAAPAGSEVRAPANGTVTFADDVPADGGGTCGAVTIELSDGRRVSLMPFEALSVSAGDALSARDVLGLLASRGDDSSAESHVHLSLRRGDVYLDPAEILVGLDTIDEGLAADAPGSASPASPPPGTAAGAAASASAVGGASGAVRAAVSSNPAPAPSIAAVGVSTAWGSVAPTIVPRAASPQLLCDARIPTASALDPTAGRAHVRPGGSLSPVAPRTATGAALLLGMLGVAVGVAFNRRAAPVQVN